MKTRYSLNWTRWHWGLWLSLLVVLPCVAFQPRILQGDGFGWDGIQYGRMIDHFRDGQPALSEIVEPFNVRVAIPFLAATIQKSSRAILGHRADNLDTLEQINYMLAALFGVLSWVMLGTLLPGNYAAILLAWLPMNLGELAAARFVGWYPATPDIASNLLGLLALWAALTRPPRWRDTPFYFGLFLVGGLVRESFLLYAPFLPLAWFVRQADGKFAWPLDRDRVANTLAIAAGSVAAMTIAVALVGSRAVSSKLGILIFWSSKALFTPILWSYVAVFGPTILLWWAGGRRAWEAVPVEIRSRIPFLVLACVLSSLISVFGGGNYERFFSWFAIVFLLVNGFAFAALIQARRWAVLGVIVGYTALLHRWWVWSDPLRGGDDPPAAFVMGCRIENYFQGWSPHLSHWAWVCPTHSGFWQIALFTAVGAAVTVLSTRFWPERAAAPQE